MLTLAEAQIKLTNRVDTLTQRMDTLADRLDTMADRLDTMADRLDTMADRLDTMAVRLETVAQQSADGDRRLGERIESLVSAIGEFIRNRPATG
jgi:methyl-accepting chemotaxis protein